MCMRAILTLACVLSLMSLPARAQQGGHPLFSEGGCFERTYSDEHLAANPNQQVQSLFVRLFQETYTQDDETGIFDWVEGWAVFRDEPDHPYAIIPGPCYIDESGLPTCGVDCDGGWMRVRRSTSRPGSLVLEVPWIRVSRPLAPGEPAEYEEDYEMGKSRDLADLREAGDDLMKPTLFRVDPVACPDPEVLQRQMALVTGGGC